MNENMLEKDFKEIAKSIKQDILATRTKVMVIANNELLSLYFKIGKIASENTKYGNNFVKKLSIYLNLEFPENINMGFSERNIIRMKRFYEEYKEFSISPTPLAKLTWSHNDLLIAKVKNFEERLWYAEKCLENGWKLDVLDIQIKTELYQRQVKNEKLTNFENKLPTLQSELAQDILKDPYIFELAGLKEEVIEHDIEVAMEERIKNVLLELGKGFSYVGRQYKVSTPDNDYYIDLLFYHLDLRCYIAVELKNRDFKPEFMGQLGFYVTAVDETMKKETDNPTIGLLLCKNKDRLSVEWALKSVNAPIGVSSFDIERVIPKEVLEKLPTEEEINLHIDIAEDETEEVE